MNSNRAPHGEVLQIDAVFDSSPEAIVRRLAATILACKGWVLQPPAPTGTIPTLNFEFQAAFCLEIYAALVQCGLHLDKSSHLRLTNAWMCARHRKPTLSPAILTVQLRMHLIPAPVHADTTLPTGGPAQ